LTGSLKEVGAKQSAPQALKGRKKAAKKAKGSDGKKRLDRLSKSLIRFKYRNSAGL